jgi:hypothetical protein
MEVMRAQKALVWGTARGAKSALTSPMRVGRQYTNATIPMRRGQDLKRSGRGGKRVSCLRGRERCMGSIVVLRWRASARTCNDRSFAEYRRWRGSYGDAASEGSIAATKEAGSAFESPAHGVSASEAVGVQVPIATRS